MRRMFGVRYRIEKFLDFLLKAPMELLKGEEKSKKEKPIDQRVQARLTRGLKLFVEKKYPEALIEAERALELDPTCKGALLLQKQARNPDGSPDELINELFGEQKPSKQRSRRRGFDYDKEKIKSILIVVVGILLALSILDSISDWKSSRNKDKEKIEVEENVDQTDSSDSIEPTESKENPEQTSSK